jgi:predicted ATPase
LWQVLEAAAVLGQVFHPRVVECMVGQEVEAALLVLEERGLVTLERSLPEEDYAFRHVLTQEAVYESLVESRRAAYHQQAAGAIEALYPGCLAEWAEPLAYYYERCGNGTRAAGSMLQGGQQALRAFDQETARIQFQRGLGWLESAPDSSERDLLEGDLQSALESWFRR